MVCPARAHRSCLCCGSHCPVLTTPGSRRWPSRWGLCGRVPTRIRNRSPSSCHRTSGTDTRRPRGRSGRRRPRATCHRMARTRRTRLRPPPPPNQRHCRRQLAQKPRGAELPDRRDSISYTTAQNPDAGDVTSQTKHHHSSLSPTLLHALVLGPEPLPSFPSVKLSAYSAQSSQIKGLSPQMTRMPNAQYRAPLICLSG